MFFDTTSLFFTGDGGETLGQYGKSKDHRSDCKQMVLGMVIDGDGIPVASEMWPGNTTLEPGVAHEIVEGGACALERVVAVGDDAGGDPQQRLAAQERGQRPPVVDSAEVQVARAVGEQAPAFGEGGGDDEAVAHAGECAGAVGGLLEHGGEVEARAKPQHRRAQRGDALAQSLDLAFERVAGLHLNGPPGARAGPACPLPAAPGGGCFDDIFASPKPSLYCHSTHDYLTP